MSPGFGVPQDAEGATRTSPPTATYVENLEKDFFGDELRGYRLLKAAKLSQQERQHILTPDVELNPVCGDSTSSSNPLCRGDL